MEVQAGDHAAIQEILKAIRSLEYVASASLIDSELSGNWARFEILPSSSGDPRSTLFEEVVRRGWKLRELSARESSLEEIFTSLMMAKKLG
jgi:hypothetical protein